MSSVSCLPSLVLALFAVVSASDDHCCLECSADENEAWSYRGLQNGPSQWAKLFPRDCNGNSQSPINIDRESVEDDKDLPDLVLQNYNIPIQKATMVNNGHTVQLMPDDNVRRTLIIGDDEYDLAQFHFHWGLHRNEGSEHTIGGKAYAMEAHFVHLDSNGRVAVVGVFLKEYAENKELTPIVNSLSDVMYKNDRTRLKSPLVLKKLLPKNPTSFYRYSGSLTTPNCTEGVIWSVISKPIPVGKSQMKEFRSLFSVTEEEASADENEDCLIAPNYRPTQPLNGRSVYSAEFVP